MDKDGDFTAECSDEELFELTEKLLEEDDNNCARFFRYNLQSRRCGDQDVCDEPLFSDVDERLFEVETVKKLMALHDNYIPVVSEEEDVTREEVREEFEFLDACLDTRVMRTLIDFLCRKGLLKTDDPQYFRRILHRMWFALYPRAYRAMGSCAFEHVFLGEVKDGKVQGFHNWLFFLLEEQRGDVNYYGFSKGFSFGRNRGGIIKTIFEWEGKVKPVSSVFIGLSPELELALYTLCVLLCPGKPVNITLGGKTLEIQTHLFHKRGKKYLSTAFPEI